MIYKNPDIPYNFNKIIEFSDNYVVWVKDSNFNSNNEYEAYIQFFNPSFMYCYVEDYKISNGNNVHIDYYYINNGYFNILDSSDIYYEKSAMLIDDSEITNSETSRADTISIIGGQVLCLIVFIWLFKQLSRLVFRGGMN